MLNAVRPRIFLGRNIPLSNKCYIFEIYYPVTIDVCLDHGIEPHGPQLFDCNRHDRT